MREIFKMKMDKNREKHKNILKKIIAVNIWYI